MDEYERNLINKWMAELYALEMPKTTDEIVDYYAKTNVTAETILKLLKEE